MENDDDLLEDQTDGEDELFNLSLDDLSPEDIDQEPAKKEPDEEIIELMELVEKGEKDLEENTGEIARLIEEEQPTKELGDAVTTEDAIPDSEAMSDQEESLSQTDLDLADLSLESDLTPFLEGDSSDVRTNGEDLSEDNIEKILEEGSEDEMDTAAIDAIDSEESLDDLIGQENQEEPIEDINMTVQSPIMSSEAPEPAEDDMIEVQERPIETEAFEEKDEEDAFRAQDTLTDSEVDITQPPVEGMISLSEEKIEAIVTRVVGDVVERVARESMAEVAERVIREAIDALKQSLEKDSD